MSVLGTSKPVSLLFPYYITEGLGRHPYSPGNRAEKKGEPSGQKSGRRYDKEVSTAGRLGSAHTEIKHLPRVGQSSEDLISCIGEKLPGTS